MPAQNAMQLKEKILMLLNRRGPALPVHVARETGLSILFSAAFLSELAADKKVKISNIKVGSSPVYFLPEHAPQLERFSEHLKSKEKDAYLLLKEKKFLKDSVLHPAIRVALREIKDFAVPFQRDNEIYWRYFTTPEGDFSMDKIETPKQIVEIKKPEILDIKEEKPIEIPVKVIEIAKEVEYDEDKETEDEEESELKEEAPRVGAGGGEEVKHKQQKPQKEKQKKIKKPVKKLQKKGNDTFFNKVKEVLTSKNIEIIDIESFNNTELMLRVREGKKESLLIAFNKKRIGEADILKAYKKASDAGMQYTIMSFGETPKKLTTFIEAIKGMSGLERVE
ncbi:MAG: hypothetical protein AABW51_03425 [Nanoarchaeota archaeon]